MEFFNRIGRERQVDAAPESRRLSG
jgi:hypothetical protein